MSSGWALGGEGYRPKPGPRRPGHWPKETALRCAPSLHLNTCVCFEYASLQILRSFSASCRVPVSCHGTPKQIFQQIGQLTFAWFSWVYLFDRLMIQCVFVLSRSRHRRWSVHCSALEGTFVRSRATRAHYVNFGASPEKLVCYV